MLMKLMGMVKEFPCMQIHIVVSVSGDCLRSQVPAELLVPHAIQIQAMTLLQQTKVAFEFAVLWRRASKCLLIQRSQSVETFKT